VIGIFMGIIWSYDFFWLFLGPEMTQDERDEEAEDARHYEWLKKEGMSLREIGSAKARGEFKNIQTGERMDVESKGAGGGDDIGRIASKDETVEHV
jgi:SHS family lactate transporter-like MFS transporter